MLAIVYYIQSTTTLAGDKRNDAIFNGLCYVVV